MSVCVKNKECLSLFRSRGVFIRVAEGAYTPDDDQIRGGAYDPDEYEKALIGGIGGRRKYYSLVIIPSITILP